MNVEIISIGDELLNGQVVNTNAAWLGEQLTAAGFQVRRVTTIPDRVEEIVTALREAREHSDVTVATGGLGSTPDDVSLTAVVRFFNAHLREDPVIAADIHAFFAGLGKQPNAGHLLRARLPENCIPLRNTNGLAPGMFFSEKEKVVAFLPGVPHEMKPMFTGQLLPRLIPLLKTPVRTKTLVTTGLPESRIDEYLKDVQDEFSGIRFAFLPATTGVRIRITSPAPPGNEGASLLDRCEAAIRERIGAFIIGSGTITLEETVGKLLTERGLTLAVAESCTGGLIGDRITDVSGSSRYFQADVVAYSNKSKIDLLQVPAETIATHGAVSGETALELAERARAVTGADLGLSTTGIAGPTGGSTEKPVGLVWVGFASGARTRAFRYRFGTDRRRVKERAAQAALDVVRRHLSDLPCHPRPEMER
ncbi:MAG: competence/damage-inducible protein A [Chlorobi bacterium]|nr:competence/damage-inducible protein A [Chlorobiota bacterium]